MTVPRIGLVCLLLLSYASDARADWQNDLSRALEARYTLGQLSFLRNSLKEPGTVLLLTLDGVYGARDSFLRNDISADEPKGLTTVAAKASPEHRKDSYLVPLTRFQPVFVTGISVARGRVTVNIATSARYVSETVDRAAINGFASGQVHEDELLSTVDVSIRRAALVFNFESSNLKTLPMDVVAAVIDLVLLPATDPRAPQPGNVAIGMTLDRVLTNLGVPVNVITLPDSQIYIYEKIRITLFDGKVVEVR